jgi:predicted RNase H-like nuclease (RuvC/YqgF family)
MLATEYLLHRQKELIDKQSELIQDLKKELENKQEIIEMLKRVNVLDEQIHQLRIQEILTPSMN